VGAAAEEGVPVYAVCTNDQMAAIARTRPDSLAALRKIEGIGEAKAQKYGARFVSAIHAGSMPAPSPPGGGGRGEGDP